MKKQDDYVSGPHHYWTHFGLGLVLGAVLGVLIGWQLFTDGWGLGAVVVLTSITAGYSCGRWGDRAWQWIIERLPWLT
ncbi:MAG TPA: hypothetical protein VN673_05760 [Clostridia bacterium]|nr:hypothetical protein [Clostridia bacterium]